MKQLGQSFMVGLVLAYSLMQVPVARGGECHNIDARDVGQVTSQSEFGAVTVSRLKGAGILEGTTAAELDYTGFNEGVLSFMGTIVITTNHGTLTLDIFDGQFDLVTGEVSYSSIVADGTGRFLNATGGLFFQGIAVGNSFTDEITGVICLE
jgi:hypothetical protein